MRAYRRAEVIEHEARAATLDARAIHQASEGHVVRAAHLAHKGKEQRVEAVLDARHPAAVAAAMRPPPVPAAVAAVELAAVTHPRPPVGAAAVVAADVAVKEAEMAMLAASRARATPNVVVVQPAGPPMVGVYPAPGAPYGYPPAPAGYPTGYPPVGAPGYPPAEYRYWKSTVIQP